VIGFVFIAYIPKAEAESCLPLKTYGTYYQNYEQVEYSPEGLLILHFKIDPAYAKNGYKINSGWRFFDDECKKWTPPNNTNRVVQLSKGVTDYSIRFTSPTHYEVWNDASSTPLVCVETFWQQGCSVDVPDLPKYHTFSWSSSIQLGTVSSISTSDYSILESPPDPPVLTDTLATPSGCSSFSTSLGYFDNYEKAEYVDGLLRIHYRYQGAFSNGGIFKLLVRKYDEKCTNLSGSIFPISATTGLLPYTRYWSFRFTSPTHWEVWSDDVNKKAVCKLCAGDIPTTIAGKEVRYVSFSGQTGPGGNSNFRGTPFATTEPKKGNSSVVFIPGTEASRLFKLSGSGTNKLWEPLTRNDVRSLFLDSNGKSIDPSVYVGDIIDATPSGSNIYKSFIKMMNDLVADKSIKEWQALPYDWRLDYNDILVAGTNIGSGQIEKMSDEITRMASTSQTGKVTIIGHSQGGLIARALISKLVASGKGALVDKLVLVAVPEAGTPEAIAGLLHGENSFSFPGNFIITDELFRSLAEHSQSAFNLLPTPSYFARVSAPVIVFNATSTLTATWRAKYGNIITTSSGLRDFLSGTDGRVKPGPDDVDAPNVLATNFLDKFATNATFQDSWTPPASLKITQIVGWGIDTLRGIKYTERIDTTCPSGLTGTCPHPVLDHRPLVTTDGDKTVISYSADKLNTETYYVNLHDFNEAQGILSPGRNHGSILEVSNARDLISAIINSTSTPLGKFVYSSKPVDPNKANRLSVHSPVSIDVYDADGRHTGIAPNPVAGSDMLYLEEQIPNSVYMEFGEGKYVSLPEGDNYSVIIKGTGVGTFTLESESGVGGNYAGGPVYTNIPVGTKSVASITLNTAGILSALNLDIDGDGKIDVTLNPGEEISIESLIDILEYHIGNLDLSAKQIKKFDKKIVKAKRALLKGAPSGLKRLDAIVKLIEKNVKNGKISSDNASTLFNLINQIRSKII